MTDSIPISSIWLKRETRQRRKMEEDLALQASIRRVGLINAVVVTRDFMLVAGERRLEACKAIGWESIPIRWAEELSENEMKIIELEENLKRKDLPWQDTCRAVAELHRIFGERDHSWNQHKTAEALSLDEGHISNVLLVASHMKDPKVSGASTLNEARNLIRRRNTRASESELIELSVFARQLFGDKEPSNAHSNSSSVDPPSPQPPPEPVLPLAAPWSRPAIERAILQTDFLEWITTYSGPFFNLLHCDFPYGVNVFSGSGQFKIEDQAGAYEDTPAEYWQLTEALAKNLGHILSPNSHIMFWLSSKPPIMTRTLDIFAKYAPPIDWYPFPLIWHKSDGSGIAGDSQRWYRHTYETALLGYRGRRPLVKVVADSYSGPGDRKLHPSCKPEPMLRHFFTALVDEHTRFLDPTCGAGSSLRAAESLGARSENILGLEIEERFVSVARESLQQFRLNAKASTIVRKSDVSA